MRFPDKRPDALLASGYRVQGGTGHEVAISARDFGGLAMPTKHWFRLTAGALGCFAAGILIADVAYKVDGAASLAIDPGILAFVVAWIGVVFAVLGWRKDSGISPQAS